MDIGFFFDLLLGGGLLPLLGWTSGIPKKPKSKKLPPGSGRTSSETATQKALVKSGAPTKLSQVGGATATALPQRGTAAAKTVNRAQKRQRKVVSRFIEKRAEKAAGQIARHYTDPAEITKRTTAKKQELDRERTKLLHHPGVKKANAHGQVVTKKGLGQIRSYRIQHRIIKRAQEGKKPPTTSEARKQYRLGYTVDRSGAQGKIQYPPPGLKGPKGGGPKKTPFERHFPKAAKIARHEYVKSQEGLKEDPIAELLLAPPVGAAGAAAIRVAGKGVKPAAKALGVVGGTKVAQAGSRGVSQGVSRLAGTAPGKLAVEARGAAKAAKQLKQAKRGKGWTRVKTGPKRTAQRVKTAPGRAKRAVKTAPARATLAGSTPLGRRTAARELAVGTGAKAYSHPILGAGAVVATTPTDAGQQLRNITGGHAKALKHDFSGTMGTTFRAIPGIISVPVGVAIGGGVTAQRAVRRVGGADYTAEEVTAPARKPTEELVKTTYDFAKTLSTGTEKEIEEAVKNEWGLTAAIGVGLGARPLAAPAYRTARQGVRETRHASQMKKGKGLPLRPGEEARPITGRKRRARWDAARMQSQQKLRSNVRFSAAAKELKRAAQKVPGERKIHNIGGQKIDFAPSDTMGFLVEARVSRNRPDEAVAKVREIEARLAKVDSPGPELATVRYLLANRHLLDPKRSPELWELVDTYKRVRKEFELPESERAKLGPIAQEYGVKPPEERVPKQIRHITEARDRTGAIAEVKAEAKRAKKIDREIQAAQGLAREKRTALKGEEKMLRKRGLTYGTRKQATAKLQELGPGYRIQREGPKRWAVRHHRESLKPIEIRNVTPRKGDKTLPPRYHTNDSRFEIRKKGKEWLVDDRSVTEGAPATAFPAPAGNFKTLEDARIAVAKKLRGEEGAPPATPLQPSILARNLSEALLNAESNLVGLRAERKVLEQRVKAKRAALEGKTTDTEALAARIAEREQVKGAKLTEKERAVVRREQREVEARDLDAEQGSLFEEFATEVEAIRKRYDLDEPATVSHVKDKPAEGIVSVPPFTSATPRRVPMRKIGDYGPDDFTSQAVGATRYDFNSVLDHSLYRPIVMEDRQWLIEQVKTRALPGVMPEGQTVFKVNRDEMQHMIDTKQIDPDKAVAVADRQLGDLAGEAGDVIAAEMDQTLPNQSLKAVIENAGPKDKYFLLEEEFGTEFFGQMRDGGWALWSGRLNAFTGSAILATSPAWAFAQVFAEGAQLLADVSSPRRLGKAISARKKMTPAERRALREASGGASADVTSVRSAQRAMRLDNRRTSKVFDVLERTPFGEAMSALIRLDAPFRMFDRWKGTVIREVGYIAHVDKHLNGFLRGTSEVYRDLGKYARELEGKPFMEQINWAITNPRAAERFGRSLDDMLGNWMTLTKRERAFSPMLIFYPFMRMSLKWMLQTFPREHPLKMATLYTLGQANAIQLHDLLGNDPSFFSGWADVPFYGGEDGEFSGFIPLGRIAPGSNTIIEAIGGSEGDPLTTLTRIANPVLSGTVGALAFGKGPFGRDIFDEDELKTASDWDIMKGRFETAAAAITSLPAPVRALQIARGKKSGGLPFMGKDQDPLVAAMQEPAKRRIARSVFVPFIPEAAESTADTEQHFKNLDAIFKKPDVAAENSAEAELRKVKRQGGNVDAAKAALRQVRVDTEKAFKASKEDARIYKKYGVYNPYLESLYDEVKSRRTPDEGKGPATLGWKSKVPDDATEDLGWKSKLGSTATGGWADKLGRGSESTPEDKPGQQAMYDYIFNNKPVEGAPARQAGGGRKVAFQSVEGATHKVPKAESMGWRDEVGKKPKVGPGDPVTPIQVAQVLARQKGVTQKQAMAAASTLTSDQRAAVMELHGREPSTGKLIREPKQAKPIRIQGLETRDQKIFAETLARKLPELDPAVIGAWVLKEGGHASGKPDNNWLNIGWTNSGPTDATVGSAWDNPKQAAKLTAMFLRGHPAAPKAGNDIPYILQNAKGKSVDEQINVIANAGWAVPGGPAYAATFKEVMNSRIKATGKAAKGSKTVYPLAQKGKIIGTPYAGTHSLGNWQSDNAVDIATKPGTPVKAVEDAVVVKTAGSNYDPGDQMNGFQLTLRGKSGQEYFYTHLSSKQIKAGQKVKAGQVIGGSGAANGVEHLHFGVKNGDPQQAWAGGATGPAPKPGPYEGSRTMVRQLLGKKVRGDKEQGHDDFGMHEPGQPGYAQDIGSSGPNRAEGEKGLAFDQPTVTKIVRNLRRRGSEIPKDFQLGQNWDGGEVIDGYEIEFLTAPHGTGPHIHIGAKWAGGGGTIPGYTSGGSFTGSTTTGTTAPSTTIPGMEPTQRKRGAATTDPLAFLGLIKERHEEGGMEELLGLPGSPTEASQSTSSGIPGFTSDIATRRRKLRRS